MLPVAVQDRVRQVAGIQQRRPLLRATGHAVAKQSRILQIVPTEAPTQKASDSGEKREKKRETPLAARGLAVVTNICKKRMEDDEGKMKQEHEAAI